MTSNKFQLSALAVSWMSNTSVCKNDEATAIQYLLSNSAPANTVEQMHHIANISNSFQTRLTWLNDLINKTKSPMWNKRSVNAVVSARLIYVAREHQARRLGNSPAMWSQLIADAISKFSL